MAWQNAHPELYDEQADQFINPARDEISSERIRMRRNRAPRTLHITHFMSG